MQMALAVPEMTVHILNDTVGKELRILSPSSPIEKTAACSPRTPECDQVLRHHHQTPSNDDSQPNNCLRRVKKSVRFVPHVTVYPIRHWKNYSRDEIERIWYSDQEWTELKMACHAMVAQVTNKSIVTVTESSDEFRGLEFRTPQGHEIRSRNRMRAISAVLDEQDFQWNCGEDDAESIAIEYSKHAHVSMDAAHKMGLEDEYRAKRVYTEDADALLALHCPQPSTTRPSPTLLHHKCKILSPPSPPTTTSIAPQSHAVLPWGLRGRA
ncbi:hypothetical protein IV203_008573 [Nitzschia inconspicua]|uniref:Uncharacterized protein n=1 Tax=Nitzschia inconspicua TaxID=303405 RepID=A0A9K3PM40_9STRA|nr:hypothetical protein IV203_008573 [Nitzschia inconspicua]